MSEGWVITSDITFVLTPVSGELKAIETKLLSCKLVLCVLAPLDLIRPGCLVAEVDTDDDGVLLEEQMTPVNVGVGTLDICDVIGVMTRFMDTVCTEQLIKRAFTRFIDAFDRVVTADGDIDDDISLVFDELEALIDG